MNLVGSEQSFITSYFVPVKSQKKKKKKRKKKEKIKNSDPDRLAKPPVGIINHEFVVSFILLKAYLEADMTLVIDQGRENTTDRLREE